jgi:WD40 repeat protein
VARSHKEDLAASGTDAGTVPVRFVPTGDLVAQLDGHADRVEALAFSPDDDLLASGSRDGTFCVWRRQAQSFEQLLQLPAPGPVKVLRFHPDGRLGMVVRGERAVRIWDLQALRRRLEQLGLGW